MFLDLLLILASSRKWTFMYTHWSLSYYTSTRIHRVCVYLDLKRALSVSVSIRAPAPARSRAAAQAGLGAHYWQVHRAQSMTLSRVELQIDGAFAPGQTYVAPSCGCGCAARRSRATGLAGLWLHSHLRAEDVRADPTVLSFYGLQ